MGDHENFMREAIKVAENAVKHGNHPFGAILVIDEKIVLSVENTVITENDVTGHAETNLVRLASKQFSTDELKRSTLYTSTEPCPMCAAAIYWGGIGCVVYGCTGSGLAKHAGQNFSLTVRELYQKGAFSPEVIGPVLQDEAEQAHRTFWKG